MLFNTLDPRFSRLDDAGTCPDDEKIRIPQMHLCNTNKMRQPSLTICATHLHYFTGSRKLVFLGPTAE